MRDIKRLKELCEQFQNITKTEHWGLSTWQLATARCVQQIADEAIKVTFGEQKTTIEQIDSKK